MKKKSIKYLFVLFFIPIFTFSQVSEYKGQTNNSLKKKKPWIGNSQFLDNYLDSINYYDYNQNFNNSLYKIPITFWLYQNDEGTSGANYEDVKKFITEVNYYYMLNNTGISFYLSDIYTIKKTKHKDFGYLLEAPFITFFNSEKGTINVHIPEALSINLYLKPKTYYKGTYNNILDNIIVIKRNSSTGLAHEIGHFFGLKHPHKDYNRGKRKQESVSRTKTKRKFFRSVLNCEVNGDCLCDTPAEPRLSKQVNKNCEYIGELTDNWGDKYIPLTDNIMSYLTYKSCREKFTNHQKAVMLYTAEHNKHSNDWKTDTLSEESAKYRFDIYEPDNFKEISTQISVNEEQNHTFHKVYKGKKNIEDNDIDWLKFSNNDSLYSLEITFDKGKYQFSNIDLQVFDENFLEIYQRDSLVSTEKIILENLTSKDIYLKIQKSKMAENVLISDYKISLKLFFTQ